MKPVSTANAALCGIHHYRMGVSTQPGVAFEHMYFVTTAQVISGRQS